MSVDLSVSKVNHPFPQPENPTDLVWRYMSLSKLISIFEAHKIFLCRTDLFEDKYEGTLPRIDKELWKNSDFKPQYIFIFLKSLRESTYVSCWHINNNESEAMWKVYCGSGEGVAIQTTYQKLRDSITEKNMHIGLISYINYENEKFPNLQGSYYPVNLMHPFMHKRKAFEHEKEIRIIKPCWELIYDSLDAPNAKIERPPVMSFEVKLENLIESIFVHPLAPDWYFEIVKATTNRYFPNLRIQWSGMVGNPEY